MQLLPRTFQMYVDDGKVGKLFGRRPELGIKLPFSINRTAGIRWQGSKETGKFKPNPISVSLMITARCVQAGLWEFTCPDVAYTRAANWLHERCGKLPFEQKRKRR